MSLSIPLVYDPFMRFDHITIVGLGGTGSHVARNVARLLYHRKMKGQSVPNVLFVDPDHVESKNIGRQMFSAGSIGQPKSQVLAQTFNLALGLQIHWTGEAVDHQKHIPQGSLVVGCVDNHLARAEIARAEKAVWLDCGNGYDFGQVIIGNSFDREQVLDGIRDARQGRCHHLPHAGLLFPELLHPEPEDSQPPETDVSCAELVERDEQHVYVNDFMGNIAGHYIYRLLNREPITTFMTQLNLKGFPQVDNSLITQAELERYLLPQ